MALVQVFLLCYLIKSVITRGDHVNSDKIEVDVVYTWVNGSDPKFIESLAHYRKLQVKSGTQVCGDVECFESNFVILPKDIEPEFLWKSYQENDLAFNLIELDSAEDAKIYVEENVYAIPAYITTSEKLCTGKLDKRFCMRIFRLII